MWKDGEFDYQGSTITYVAKVYDVTSEFGIDNGRVVKLDLRNSDHLVADYDRGWETYPESEQDEDILEKFLELFA